jgi:site-specific DNA recombinase
VRLLEHGESVRSIIRDWTKRGLKPVAAKHWYPSTWVGTMTSARIAGLREWQGTKYPADWPAIIDVDTHERLVKMFADPGRRKHVVRAQAHLLSGIATCPHCGRGLHYRGRRDGRADQYACVSGPYGCGRCAIKAVLLEEYVTGAVLDALESPRVQEALRDGDLDSSAPRRAELIAEIQRAQEVRADARRDLADGIIDRADWLDIRQRTEDSIAAARREYDRLSGSATVMSDIPPSERIRDAWESWNTDRKRAAIQAVLHQVIINPVPPGVPNSPGGMLKDPAIRREREMAILRQRVEFDWRV